MPQRSSRSGRGLLVAASLPIVLAACDRQNHYVAAPPPQVTVVRPLEQSVTPYIEATGNTVAFNSVDLVARVQGFLQEINYQDGTAVKAGTPLFVIEPEPYHVKLEQAEASEEGAKAALKNAEAEYSRQQDLLAKQVSAQTSLDKALADRDQQRANVDSSGANKQLAQINLDYTTVKAPFDGVVTAHLVSVGELVGTDQQTKLATIIQLNPIHVTFNVSENDVLRVRAAMARRGVKPSELVGKIAVEVGLQSETGYPHKGVLDYAAPFVDQSTGTLQARGLFENPERALLPGYFVRVRVPLEPGPALLVPEAALGSDQTGRYVLIANADNVVEQRKVELGQQVGEMRVITSGLKPDDRVIVGGILSAIAGEKVDPQMQKTASAGEAQPTSQ
jgi:RND family efflux transporter MFP subunit